MITIQCLFQGSNFWKYANFYFPTDLNETNASEQNVPNNANVARNKNRTRSTLGIYIGNL